jgi:uncharacterized protein YqhQ
MAGVGGQAVLNGVMMRGQDRWSVAVRRPDGSIALRVDELAAPHPWEQKVPLVRGLFAVGRAIPIGVRATRWSAAQAGAGRPGWQRLATGIAVLVLVLAACVVPAMVVTQTGFVGAVLENVLSLGVLLGGMAATGRLDRVRRLFEYHGAEHKAVSAFEAGGALTADEARRFSTRHARCGTSLLVWIIVAGAIVGVTLGRVGLPSFATFALVLGLATETQLRAASAADRPWVAALLRPGLALQRVTTREPSPEQLEVALAALVAVVPVPAPSPVEAPAGELVLAPA